MTIEALRSRIANFAPDQILVFDESVSAASEVVVFGSAARNQLTGESDIDVLFVGTGERLKTSVLDFIWITPDHLSSERWLGSELAVHIAAYGVWLKGRGEWRASVFFSEFAVTQKCERILVRLSKLYLKRTVLRRTSLVELSSRAVLDMQRAVLLNDRIAVPTTADVIAHFLQDPARTLTQICSDGLLGDLGRYFIETFLPTLEIIEYLKSIARE